MRPRLKRWIKRGILGLLGLIVALVAFVTIALQTDWGQRQVREQVVTALGKTFTGEVSIGDMDVGLSGAVELSDLRILYPNGEVAIEVDRLSIDCRLLPLIGGRVRCGTLRVVGPRFWHRPDAGPLMVPDDSESTSNVRIAAIAIEQGRVELPTEVISAIEVRIAKLDLDGPDVSLIVESLAARAEAQDRRVSFSGGLAIKGGVLALADGVVESGKSQLMIGVERFDLESMEIAATVAGTIAGVDIPVDGWLADVSPEIAVSGVVGESVAASGVINLAGGVVSVESVSYGDRLAGKLDIAKVDPSAVYETAPPGEVSASEISFDMKSKFGVTELEGSAKVVLGGTIRGEELGEIVIEPAADPSGGVSLVVGATSKRGGGSINIVARRDPEKLLIVDTGTIKGDLSSVAALVPGLRTRSVNANINIEGPIDKLLVNGRVTTRGIRYEQIGADSVVAVANLKAFDVKKAAETRHSGGFRVDIVAPVFGESSGASLSARGTISNSGDTIVVTVTGKGFPMVERAEATATVTLGDTITATVNNIDVTTANLRWRGSSGRIVKRGDDIKTTRRIGISSAAATLSVGAQLDPTLTKVNVNIERFDVGAARALHGSDIRVTGSGRADVAIKRGLLTGSVSASTNGLAIPGVPAIAASFGATLDTGKLAVVADAKPVGGVGTVHLELDARRPADIFDVAGWRRLQTSDLLRVQGDVEGVSVKEIERFVGAPIPAKGRAKIALRLPYKGQHALGVEVDADRGRYAGIGGLRTHVRATWGADITASMSFHQAGDKLATGNLASKTPLHLAWQAPEKLTGRQLTGDLTISNFSLRRVSRLKLVDLSLAGFMTMKATVKGTALAPEVVISDGKAVQVAVNGVTMRRVFFSGGYRGDEVTGRVAGFVRSGGRFEVKADYMIDKRDLEIDLDAKGLRLSALRPFAPASDHPLADLDGVVDIKKVVVRVDPKTMRASGRVAMRAGQVLLEGGARAITGINASLILRNDKIRLARLVAKNGSGTISASGQARFEGYTPAEISIDAKAKDIPYVAGSYLASIDLESEITGSYRDGVLALRAPVRRGRVDVEDTGHELQSIGELEDVVFTDGKPRFIKPGQPPERGLKTEIVVDLSRGIRVKTAEVDALVGGSIEVSFVGAQMTRLFGELRARSGRIKLFERNYDLVRAIATFQGPVPMNPDLDVEINRTFPEATVTARITGRLSQVLAASSQSKHIELTSDADFSEEQILALMLGQSPDDVVQQSSGGSRVGGIGRAIVATEVRDILRSVGLKVDVVRFHDDGWEFGKWIRVRLGDWFSRRILVGWRIRDSGESDENTNEGTLELPVTRSVNLEGRVGDRGIGNVDLLWIKRF